jgi:hypothetical protein
VPTRLSAVVMRAPDSASLREFWTRALGADAVAGRAGGVALEFVAAPGPKTGKNRVHLDLRGGPGELERLLAAGAARVDIGQGPDVGWEVLADPAGNEFCLQSGDEAGLRWSALCQDAGDPAAQSRFWAAATGWSVFREGEWGVAMREPGRADGLMLVMGPPVAAKSGPNRLYPILTANQGSTAEVEASRLVAEGATRAGALLLDPEGNELRVVEAPRP